MAYGRAAIPAGIVYYTCTCILTDKPAATYDVWEEIWNMENSETLADARGEAMLCDASSACEARLQTQILRKVALISAYSWAALGCADYILSQHWAHCVVSPSPLSMAVPCD